MPGGSWVYLPNYPASYGLFSFLSWESLKLITIWSPRPIQEDKVGRNVHFRTWGPKRQGVLWIVIWQWAGTMVVRPPTTRW